MGKTKKNKPRIAKVNPLGIPSVRDASRDETLMGLEDAPEGPIPAILDQLQSANNEDKMNAMQSLAVLSLNLEKAKLICSSVIVRVVAPYLMDANESLRNASAGALRNLSLSGVEICESLVEQDILTPLLALLTEYADKRDWVPSFDPNLNNQHDQNSDTFFQAINILWNLCESTSIALDNLNQTLILESFIRCLNYKVFGVDISIAVAQCLLVISEDNPHAWSILTNYLNELLYLFTIDGSYPEVFLRTLAASIISNVPALAIAHLYQILSTLSKTLEINHRAVLGNITSRLPLLDEINVPQVDMSDDVVLMEESEEAASLRRRRQDLPSEIEIEVKHVEWLLQAQSISAETITNICSSEDEACVINGNDNESDAESVHDYDASSDAMSVNQNIDKLPIEVQEAIKSFNIVEKLYQQSQPLPINVLQIIRENSQSLLKRTKSLRISSMLCLQNLCNCLSTEDLGGPKAIYNVWLDIGQQVFQGPQDPKILEPSTSLMRATLEHLRRSPELFTKISESDLQLMLNGVEKCSDSEIRANWLRMLGILGCLLPEPLVKIIMSFLIDTSLNEHEAWTISEAVDALMDMFSDNDWNQIAYELKLEQKAKDLEKVLKNRVRQQKKTLNERYPAVMTVKVNLSRFTKYIEAQMKSFTPNTVR